MFNKLINKKPPEHTITTDQLVLLYCRTKDCGNLANPENAVVTGVLGIGKVVVHFCAHHEGKRKEGLVELAHKRNAKRKEVS